MDATGVAGHLNTAWLGRLLEYHPVIPSTNDRCKELGRAGAPHGSAVLADAQSSGRGRLGRAWLSPPGCGVWLSVLLRPHLPVHQVSRLTLTAAVAVAEAIGQVTGLTAGIKWPNDLLLNGRKCCGILTELETAPGQAPLVVVGIGINVNLQREDFPPDLQPTATALLAELGHPVDRAALAAAVLERLEHWYGQTTGGWYAGVLHRWQALSVTLGRRVRVLPAAGGAALEGLAAGVDPDGALLLRLDTGAVERVLAGEVSLRSVD